ncbi:hypothetical protein [Rhizobium sp. G21]|uniref:hypothetical protein n=1 Tax=Rhizobium sp. G21 TaxID=2758439 RepID=UPI001FEE090A|nr:hypothetical protein [Rhizobium sp. G21]
MFGHALVTLTAITLRSPGGASLACPVGSPIRRRIRISAGVSPGLRQTSLNRAVALSRARMRLGASVCRDRTSGIHLRIGAARRHRASGASAIRRLRNRRRDRSVPGRSACSLSQPLHNIPKAIPRCVQTLRRHQLVFHPFKRLRIVIERSAGLCVDRFIFLPQRPL